MASSLYPQDLDYFREYLDSMTDHMVAQDINDLWGVVTNIQQELGIKPSGTKGTVWSRLFENGNIDPSAPFAGWRPLKWEVQTVTPANRFDRRSLSGHEVLFNTNQFAGQETAFGEDTPAAFGQTQGPLDLASGALGTNGRGGVPWRGVISNITSSRVNWVARDGEGQDMNNFGGGISCKWGYLLWNLITNGLPLGEEE